MKRAGLGRRTAQFNPAAQGASSVGQWLTTVMSMKGESDAMSVPAAVERISARRHPSGAASLPRKCGG